MGLSPITFSEIVRGPNQPHEKTNKASGEGGRACIFYFFGICNRAAYHCIKIEKKEGSK
jgi:hypothetical protein